MNVTNRARTLSQKNSFDSCSSPGAAKIRRTSSSEACGKINSMRYRAHLNTADTTTTDDNERTAPPWHTMPCVESKTLHLMAFFPQIHHAHCAQIGQIATLGMRACPTRPCMFLSDSLCILHTLLLYIQFQCHMVGISAERLKFHLQRYVFCSPLDMS